MDPLDGSSDSTHAGGSAGGGGDYDVLPTLVLGERDKPSLVLRIDTSASSDGRSAMEWSVTPFRVSVFAPYWLINRTGHALHFATEGDVQSLLAAQVDKNAWQCDAPLAGQRAPPLMYSYGELGGGLYSRMRTCVRVDGSRWSKGISLDSPGTVGALEIPNR